MSFFASLLSSLFKLYCQLAIWIEQNPYLLSAVRWVNCLITREPYNWSVCYVYRDNGTLIQNYDNDMKKVIEKFPYTVFYKTKEGVKILVNKIPSSFVPLKMVRNRFLSVQYKTNEEIVDIELPNEYYMEGNEILSSLFIERYCKQYHPSLEFNDNYALVIIDNSLKETILTGNQYILLLNNGFQTFDIVKLI